jgi:hypothetical protein
MVREHGLSHRFIHQASYSACVLSKTVCTKLNLRVLYDQPVAVRRFFETRIEKLLTRPDWRAMVRGEFEGEEEIRGVASRVAFFQIRRT